MDAWVEISGNFLFIEQKSKRDPSTTKGQWNALLRLARQPNCTVWYIEDRPGGNYSFSNLSTSPKESQPITHDELRVRVKMWGEYADANPVRMSGTNTKRALVAVSS